MALTVPAVPVSLDPWRARAGRLSPALAEALDACAARVVNQAECCDVLDLLGVLGCDAQTQAAALWFELARVDPALWAARRGMWMLHGRIMGGLFVGGIGIAGLGAFAPGGTPRSR